MSLTSALGPIIAMSETNLSSQMTARIPYALYIYLHIYIYLYKQMCTAHSQNMPIEFIAFTASVIASNYCWYCCYNKLHQ